MIVEGETIELEKKGEENNNKKEDSEFEKLPSDYVKCDFKYKIIIIGDSAVGKTSMMNRMIDGEFLDKISPTLGFDYRPLICRYKDKILKLEIWDTCGQEVYRSLIKGFFTNSSLAVIVYAVDDEKSFNSLNEWIRQCKLNCSPETKFVLIGNKTDLKER